MIESAPCLNRITLNQSFKKQKEGGLKGHPLD